MDNWEINLLKAVLYGKDTLWLSKVLKVSQKSIYRWLNGECKPSKARMKKLEAMYGARYAMAEKRVVDKDE